MEAGWGFHPAAFFASGDVGDWWDASDLSRMRQDSAGLTAAAVGQPVGWMLGGRDTILRIQTTPANRPTLEVDANGRYYLADNGTNRWMQSSAAVDFSGTDKMTVVGAWTKLSDAVGFGMCLELGDRTAGLAGSLSLTAPESAGTSTYLATVEGATGSASAIPNGYAAPISNVLSVSANLGGATSADQIGFRVDGALVAATGASGGGNFGNHPLYWGARAGTSLYFNGREYISAIVGAAKSESQIALMERFCAAKAGITL